MSVRGGIMATVVGVTGGAVALDQVPVATTGVATAAVLAAAWHGWDRTTLGDVERWNEIRKAGGRVTLRELLIAHFPGTPRGLRSSLPVADESSLAMPVEADSADMPLSASPLQGEWARQVQEDWARRVGAGMAAAGYPVNEEFGRTVARALAAAGPVPDDAEALSTWVDVVTDVLLAEGYRTRAREANLLIGVARQVGRPRGLTVAS